jgi:hypothetical protein
MSVELTIVSLLLKMLRDDPTVPQLKQLNERIQRLSNGSYLDGISALEDALGQQNISERERLVSLALEYFRQGYSRSEPPWSSLCAESVARCYQALNKPLDARRWMERAWDRWLSDYKSILANISRDKKAKLKYVKEDVGLQSWMALAKVVRNGLVGRRTITEISDTQWSVADQWQTLFLLESQARRLREQLGQMGIVTAEVRLYYPPDAQRPVLINGLNSDYWGYITYDGEVRS